MDTQKLFELFLDTAGTGGYINNEDFMQDLYNVFEVLLKILLCDAKGEPISLEERQPLLFSLRMHINERLEETDDVFSLRFFWYIRKQNLSEYQVLALLLGGASHFNRNFELLFASLHGNDKSVFPSRFLLDRLCDSILVETEQSLITGGEFEELHFRCDLDLWKYHSALSAPLLLKPWILDFFLGRIELPYSMRDKVTLFTGTEPLHERIGCDTEWQQLLHLCDRKEPVNILLCGRRNSGKRFLLKHLAKAVGHRLMFVSLDLLLKTENNMEEIADLRLLAALHQAEICIFDENEKLHSYQNNEESPSYPETPGNRPDFLPLLLSQENAAGRNVYATRQETDGQWYNCQDSFIRLSLHSYSTEERVKGWQSYLSLYPYEGLNPQILGSKYLLTPGETEAILKLAWKIAVSNCRDMILSSDVIEAIRQKNANVLGPFADWMAPCFHWDDLVVSEEARTQLRYIENRLLYRNVVGQEWGFDEKLPYGRGVCTLFFGPPGTGKTMAAQVLANELGMDLYRIDISRMVSKYIGETQKNISDLFERAKHVNAILFFDEADALFSKRLDVSDSNDRNANSEVAHLLQKLEEYEGISILATNLKNNIDNAFKRRIKYMVSFSMPDEATRLALWKKILPEKAQTDGSLNLEYFAKNFELSGSEIKEAMLHAAYMAAAEQKPIGNLHIAEAVRIAMAKYGRILTPADFNFMI